MRRHNNYSGLSPTTLALENATHMVTAPPLLSNKTQVVDVSVFKPKAGSILENFMRTYSERIRSFDLPNLVENYYKASASLAVIMKKFRWAQMTYVARFAAYITYLVGLCEATTLALLIFFTKMNKL